MIRGAMRRETYQFTIQNPKSHLKILVSEEGIRILKVQSGGFGALSGQDDACKAKLIGRVATLGHIWKMRIKGYTFFAEIALGEYKQKCG